MKKTTDRMGAVVVGCAMLVLIAVSAPAAQRPGFETYVVRSGDTLSRISGRVFGDVKRWREILKENPQVTNANLIFPGDILLVPVPGSAATAGGTGGGLAASTGAGAGISDADAGSVRSGTVAAPTATSEQGTAGASSNAGFDADSGDKAGSGAGAPAVTDIATTVPPVEQLRATTVVNPAIYRTAGYIADNLPAIAIVASPDDRVLLGSGDAAIVNAPISPGTRFTVVRGARRVFHPVTRKNLGWLIRILGTAEVTCRGERTSTVALRTMNDAASVGDYLVPIDPNDVLEQNVLDFTAQQGCIPAGASDGMIVAFNGAGRVAGELELAYIDRGTAEGVTPGQRFTIYRELAPEGRGGLGELQVLRVGAHTATALITNSVQEIQVGYLLRVR